MPRSRETALLVLFARTARTRIVAADLRRAANERLAGMLVVVVVVVVIVVVIAVRPMHVAGVAMAREHGIRSTRVLVVGHDGISPTKVAVRALNLSADRQNHQCFQARRADGGLFTRNMPSATRTSAAPSRHVTGSDRMRCPAITAKIGPRKVNTDT